LHLVFSRQMGCIYLTLVTLSVSSLKEKPKDFRVSLMTGPYYLSLVVSPGRRNTEKELHQWVTLGLCLWLDGLENGFKWLTKCQKGTYSVRSIDVSDYFEKSTSRAAFDCPVWLDRVNQEAVRRGVIPPKTK